MLGDWLTPPVTMERARRFDRLIESMYEWLEESDGTRLNPVLATTIRQAELLQEHLVRSAEEVPSLF